MKRTLRNIVLSFLAGTMLFSCTEIVDIELDSTYTRLVVYGAITTDSLQHSVQLTKTTDYFYTEEPPTVSGALVEVSYADKRIQLEEHPAQSGIYVFPEAIRGQIGETYVLTVSGVDVDEDGGEETYNATTTLPGISEPDSLSLIKFITPFFSGYQVALWSPEPEGSNWYNFKLIINGTVLNNRLSEFTVQPDDFVTDGYTAGFPVGFLDDEDEEEAVFPGDTVMLEINSITEQYYNFITQAQSEIFGNNPLFSGPPANVSTNLSNSAQGIFTSYSIKRIFVIAPMPQIPVQ